VRGRRDPGLLCRQFFGRNTTNDLLEKIALIRLEDITERNGIKTLDQLNMDVNINFSLVEYMRLSEAITFFLDKKKRCAGGRSDWCSGLFLSFDKGSKKIRKALSAKGPKIDILKVPSMTTFLNISTIGNATEKITRNAAGFWNFSLIKNTMKEFQYKFIFNQLGLNSRVSHFVQNYSKACTLCTKSAVPAPVPDETSLHLFYDCPTTSSIRDKITRKYFSALVHRPRNILLRFWLLAEVDNNTNLFISAAVCTLNYLI
jgi:hypothetical protein